MSKETPVADKCDINMLQPATPLLETVPVSRPYLDPSTGDARTASSEIHTVRP